MHAPVNLKKAWEDAKKRPKKRDKVFILLEDSTSSHPTTELGLPSAPRHPSPRQPQLISPARTAHGLPGAAPPAGQRPQQPPATGCHSPEQGPPPCHPPLHPLHPLRPRLHLPAPPPPQAALSRQTRCPWEHTEQCVVEVGWLGEG